MRVNITDVILVLVGGGLGALARWVLSSIVQERIGSIFPYGTLLVNLLGSLLLGFIMTSSLTYGVMNREQRLLLATGFAGGFTTFSTFSYETLELLLEAPLDAIAYILGNVLGGLAAVWVGSMLATFLYGR